MRSVLCAVMVLATVPAFAVEGSAVRKLDTNTALDRDELIRLADDG